MTFCEGCTKVSELAHQWAGPVASCQSLWRSLGVSPIEKVLEKRMGTGLGSINLELLTTGEPPEDLRQERDVFVDPRKCEQIYRGNYIDLDDAKQIISGGLDEVVGTEVSGYALRHELMILPRSISKASTGASYNLVVSLFGQDEINEQTRSITANLDPSLQKCSANEHLDIDLAASALLVIYSNDFPGELTQTGLTVKLDRLKTSSLRKIADTLLGGTGSAPPVTVCYRLTCSSTFGEQPYTYLDRLPRLATIKATKSLARKFEHNIRTDSDDLRVERILTDRKETEWQMKQLRNHFGRGQIAEPVASNEKDKKKDRTERAQILSPKHLKEVEWQMSQLQNPFGRGQIPEPVILDEKAKKKDRTKKTQTFSPEHLKEVEWQMSQLRNPFGRGQIPEPVMLDEKTRDKKKDPHHSEHPQFKKAHAE
ncbi:hypothetical protein GNI_038220 [Gregarina niphandrodes]|uniref:Uncharacterized protein n=1 Tax=Gregarina niphandrodes TaxID=110365 RepID=A0A023BAK7_GRENI|nr:hypothetical protein GNI_038220 [Gregarina niphandrodes]EZG78312.1 hypothetical protein GNI_038220 [Gregarina niphandrodes]|eukprot:XP_011129350.1 hypothetical protein GNI_038220 [Gregarina niphandrodes]